jgi:shikimate kinase
MNIVLFGFMGTGKSAVAQMLARRLNLRWLDMDKEIETKEGRRIEEIFEKDGEVFFRGLERKLVQELIKQDNLVVSTGGGVVLTLENIKDFENWGLCICLNSKPEIIFERTRYRKDRPLLKEQDSMKKILELLELRQPYYEKIANQVDTSDKSINDIVETILGLIRKYEKETHVRGGDGNC